MTSPFPIICARDGLGFNHFFHGGYVATLEMGEARGMTSLTSFPIICARDGPLFKVISLLKIALARSHDGRLDGVERNGLGRIGACPGGEAEEEEGLEGREETRTVWCGRDWGGLKRVRGAGAGGSRGRGGGKQQAEVSHAARGIFRRTSTHCGLSCWPSCWLAGCPAGCPAQVL